MSGQLLVCEVIDEDPHVAWNRLHREASRLTAGNHATPP